MSRSDDKLRTVAKEIGELSANSTACTTDDITKTRFTPLSPSEHQYGRKTRTIRADFTEGHSIYPAIAEGLQGLEIGILGNRTNYFRAEDRQKDVIPSQDSVGHANIDTNTFMLHNTARKGIFFDILNIYWNGFFPETYHILPSSCIEIHSVVTCNLAHKDRVGQWLYYSDWLIVHKLKVKKCFVPQKFTILSWDCWDFLVL